MRSLLVCVLGNFIFDLGKGHCDVHVFLRGRGLGHDGSGRCTTWRDVGALEGVRDELEMAIVEPIQNPQRYAKVGISAPTGVLLWGPPGCGKTLLAKAVAAESKANFISVKGPELLNKVRDWIISFLDEVTNSPLVRW